MAQFHKVKKPLKVASSNLSNEVGEKGEMRRKISIRQSMEEKTTRTRDRKMDFSTMSEIK